jgi:CBS domain-containing protein
MTDDLRRKVARVSHPILRLEVIRPDGTRSSEHRVFCRYQERSVRVGTCCACTHCDEIASAPRPAVHCTIAVGERAGGRDRLGMKTPVGVALALGAVAIDPQTTVREALRVLRAEDRRSVAIVDESHVVVGVLHEATFASRSGLPGELEAAVVHVMSGTLAIHELIPVRRALELLAAAHLREGTVVDDQGVPLGVFRDVDGLRWLASARDEG